MCLITARHPLTQYGPFDGTPDHAVVAFSGRLQVQSPAPSLTAVSSPAAAVAPAAAVLRPEQSGGEPPGQHHKSVSALLQEASHLTVSSASDQKQGSLHHSSMGPPATESSATSSANKKSSPQDGSRLLSGEGLASPSSADEAAQHQAGGFCWQARHSGRPARLDGTAERRQPLHRRGAPVEGMPTYFLRPHGNSGLLRHHQQAL